MLREYARRSETYVSNLGLRKQPDDPEREDLCLRTPWPSPDGGFSDQLLRYAVCIGVSPFLYKEHRNRLTVRVVQALRCIDASLLDSVRGSAAE